MMFWYRWQYANGEFCPWCGKGYLEVESLVALHGFTDSRENRIVLVVTA